MPQPRRRQYAPRHLLALLGPLPVLACGSGWQAVGSPWPAAVEPRQQVQIWTRGQPIRVHALGLTQDSVSGISYLQATTCDACRIAFSRAQIDSLRTGDPAGGFWASVILGSVGLLLVGLWSGLIGPPGT